MRPRKGQAFLKLKKRVCSSIRRQQFKCASQLLSQRKSRVLLRPSITGSRSLEYLDTPYVVLFLRPDIAWLAREAIRLLMKEA